MRSSTTRQRSTAIVCVLFLGFALAVVAACSGPDELDGDDEDIAEATATAPSNPAEADNIPPDQSTSAPSSTPDDPAETPEQTATEPNTPTSTEEAVTATSPDVPTPTPTEQAPPTATATPAPSAPVDLGAINIGIQQVGSGFSQPDFVTHAGDGSGRTFVVEKTGSIRLLDGTVYLDITDRVLFYDLLTVEHELGLLGLAFHPNFEENGFFYVYYTDLGQNRVVSRFVEGPNGVADPASEQVLISYPQPDVNFVGGMLAFGRDGYLYIGMGSGTSVDAEQVVSQDLGSLHGKILRIDVDNGDPYAIPPDNPFVNDPEARPEVWAYGLRNPWRFAFDRATNDLYIGGPGEFVREWVHFVAGGNAAGLNFGWPILEGDQCWEAAVLPCDTVGLEMPILTYPRANGNCVVIGGYPYRGPGYPELQGAYLYGDYCTGRIWGAARDESGTWQTVELLDTDMLITSFGEDEAGELYVCDGLSGAVYRIVAG